MSEEPIDEPASSEHVACDEGLAAFEYASNLDSDDREGEAIPMYRRALTYGLPSEVEYKALVQLGSSLRVVNDVRQRLLPTGTSPNVGLTDPRTDCSWRWHCWTPTSPGLPPSKRWQRHCSHRTTRTATAIVAH